MNILNLIKRPVLQSINRQMQCDEVDHVEVWPERELTPNQVRTINRLKAIWQWQSTKIYKELNK